ncbi:hypothetical protein EVAR_76738_1 [Eumeta japonica]|uniref:Uncharacterized protein n=1 Tax=Eumeta variegata TaxID=151549 RepID=A0A4C1SST1_EUMVA|nr:hypothetical protein EVAR_76738_1 [Eumeta japonica]
MSLDEAVSIVTSVPFSFSSQSSKRRCRLCARPAPAATGRPGASAAENDFYGLPPEGDISFLVESRIRVSYVIREARRRAVVLRS